MKPFTECRIFNYLSLASSPKQTVSDEEFSSSYTEYEQYLYDLAIESVSVSERLRHLLHSKVELISLKKLFTRTGHFHTAVAEFYLDKCLLLVEAEIELVNFGVQYPGTITTPSSFLSSLHWKGSLVNLMELISSLDYSGLITDESGNASLSPVSFPLLRNSSMLPFPNHMTCVPTLPGAKRTIPSCCPN